MSNDILKAKCNLGLVIRIPYREIDQFLEEISKRYFIARKHESLYNLDIIEKSIPSGSAEGIDDSE